MKMNIKETEGHFSVTVNLSKSVNIFLKNIEFSSRSTKQTITFLMQTRITSHTLIISSKVIFNSNKSI